jgi:hypothetical protein
VIAFSTRFGIEPRDIQTTSVQVRDVGEVTSPPPHAATS